MNISDKVTTNKPIKRFYWHKKQFSFFFIGKRMKTPEIIASNFAKTQLNGQFTVSSFIFRQKSRKPLFFLLERQKIKKNLG